MNDSKSKKESRINQITIIGLVVTILIGAFSVFISLRSLDYNKRVYELTNSTVDIQKESKILLFAVKSLVDVYYDDNYLITNFSSVIVNDGYVICQLDEIIYTYTFECKNKSSFSGSIMYFIHNLEDNKVRTSYSIGYSDFDFETYSPQEPYTHVHKPSYRFQIFHEIISANWVLSPSDRRTYTETHRIRYKNAFMEKEPYTRYPYNLTNVTIEFIYHDENGIRKEEYVVDRRYFNYFHPDQ